MKMKKKVKCNEFILYPQKCTGCRACEMACSYVHMKNINPSLSNIKVTTDKEKGEIYIRINSNCAYCKTPYCQQFCETGAIKVTSKEYNSLSI